MVPVIFIARYAIKPGDVEAFRLFLDELVNALEASDRLALAINAYVNKEGTEAIVVEISSHADSIKHYWRAVHQLSGRSLESFGQGPASVEVYGPSGDVKLERTRHSGGPADGLTLMTEHVVGFTRMKDQAEYS